MGANCSLPDGTDLKAPEERIPHDLAVRANLALVFVKPHAYAPASIEFVRKELTSVKGLAVLGECSQSGEQIAEGDLVDKHYDVVANAALVAAPSETEVSDEKKAAFAEKFGQPWDDCVANGSVLNAKDCALSLGTPGDAESGAEAEPMSERDLLNLWLVADKVKVAKDVYVAKVKGGGGDPDGDDYDEMSNAEGEAAVYCVNGFYPALKAQFTKPEASVRLFVVAFDPEVLSWAKFRAEVIGATNPADAEPSSIRAKMLAQHEALGMEEAPNNSNNGVHASASPLEALKERLIWLNFTLDSDPTGSKLVELAVWDESKRPVLDSLLENPNVDVAGMKGKAFDILEDKDTPDLYVLANNVAFAKELEGVC
jgi:hypothetical protein